MRNAKVGIILLPGQGNGAAVFVDALAKAAAEKGSSYEFVDWPAGSIALDAAILVVSAVDGPSPHALKQLLRARDAHVACLIVALIEVDDVDDPELLDLVELELRELVKRGGYPGDVPIVHLSAFKVLEGSARSISGVVKLVNALDDCVAPQR